MTRDFAHSPLGAAGRHCRADHTTSRTLAYIEILGVLLSSGAVARAAVTAVMEAA